MSAWLKKNKNLWAPTIFVLVFGFVAVAYAVIEFALTGRVVPGALLIAGLIVLAVYDKGKRDAGG